ncbi:TetR/AcrR family transcriptional regulator [Nocardioides caldifontis]|uniref:TetR/AcrR family transcriptional regulator n=1 Tax=Nocardioides caldifontis TaxID=2588938 RepID=UPI0011DFECD8|nr:TetR/AcrR family transcriptional regulator [Nocardioides caldifontis]
MVPAGRRATPLPPEERRAAIVSAVIPLLEATGGVLSTKQIADAAGIAEGTIFRVFPDKRALLYAVGQEVVTPAGWREEMAAMLDQHPTLHAKVLAVTERMVDRTRRLMLVVTAIRRNFMTDGPPPVAPDGQPALPPFMRDSGAELHAALSTLVFAPHRDELATSPEHAARALQALVAGTCHPGAPAETTLTPVEITQLLLHGVTRDVVDELLADAASLELEEGR